MAAFLFFSEQYSYFTIVSHPGDYPFRSLAVVGPNLWHPAFSLFVFAVLLFPHGKLLSARWRPVAWCTAIVYGIGLISGQFVRGAEADEAGLAFVHVVKPEPLASIPTAVFDVFLPLQLAFVALAAVSLVVRLRRSTGEERQQIKWLAFSVAVVALAFPLGLILIGNGALGAMLLPLIPISAGVAILKYRLYDIDVIINRTLVYGALTATLAGSYLGLVLLFGRAPGPLTEDSDLAIAGSTLAVAALFRPVRARIQALVDRRFYRRRYDAARTLAAFSASLRDEVDLDRLSDDLIRVVDEAMQPSRVSLWLRPPDWPARRPSE